MLSEIASLPDGPVIKKKTRPPFFPFNVFRKFTLDEKHAILATAEVSLELFYKAWAKNREANPEYYKMEAHIKLAYQYMMEHPKFDRYRNLPKYRHVQLQTECVPDPDSDVSFRHQKAMCLGSLLASEHTDDPNKQRRILRAYKTIRNELPHLLHDDRFRHIHYFY